MSMLRQDVSRQVLAEALKTGDIFYITCIDDPEKLRPLYEKYKSNLPDGFTEIIIDGGNHAGFGMYGEQAGDGASDISSAEQISVTADYIADFILRK